jgi:hypothetical protein
MNFSPLDSVNVQLRKIGAPPIPSGFTVETQSDYYIVRGPNVVAFFPRGKAITKTNVRAAALMLRTPC